MSLPTLPAGFDLSAFQPLSPWLTSVALGLLMGLERERNPAAMAGVRTFSLVALSGTLAAMLSERGNAPWILAAGLLVLGGMMIAAHLRNGEQGEPEADPGTTTVAAVVVCYGLGALLWYGEAQLAVTLGILATLLLYFKTELHGVASALTRRDLLSILQFAVLSLVVLPLLPNQDFGPYQALNPYQVWWMVVLISGLSLAGYAALRIAGPRQGALLTGLFGGVASSTATTLAFARHARDDRTPGAATLAAAVILTANWVVLVRIALIVAVVAPSLLAQLAWIFAGGLALGGPWLWRAWRALPRGDAQPHAAPLQLGNPVELKVAFGFGLLYAGVLLLSAWLNVWAGQLGMTVVAMISGLTDMDAITLSSLRLFNLGALDAGMASLAMLLALLANTAFKTGLALTLGGKPLARAVGPGMLGVALGCVAGFMLSGWLGA